MLEYCASHMCGHALGVQCPHSQLIAVAGEVWYWFECAQLLKEYHPIQLYGPIN